MTMILYKNLNLYTCNNLPDKDVATTILKTKLIQLW